jgi:hypothetical protein
MPKFIEITDSKTDNVTCNNSIYKGCGVAGTSDATGSDFDSVASMRASQAVGNLVPKQSGSDSRNDDNNQLSSNHE